jgi:hypothetical protein
VRNEQNAHSDRDVPVEFSEAPDIFQFMELEDLMTELLGVKVDLASPTSTWGG